MTRHGDRVGLAHHMLDHQLIDSRGERCGKVDDIALEPDGHGTMVVRGLLAGPGVLQRRSGGRFTRWLVGLAGDRQVEVRALHVGQIIDHVSLTMPAPELGLAQGEQRAADVLERVLGPDAHAVKLGPDDVAEAPIEDEDRMVRLSALLGRRAVDQDGRTLGHIHELIVEKSGPLLSEAAGNAWVVQAACYGRSALRARLGLGHPRMRQAEVATWPQTTDEPFVLATRTGRRG